MEHGEDLGNEGLLITEKHGKLKTSFKNRRRMKFARRRRVAFGPRVNCGRKIVLESSHSTKNDVW